MFHGVRIVTAGIPATDIAAVYGDGRQIGTICLVDGEKVFRVEQEPPHGGENSLASGCS
jgi:hypothetical protein